MMKRGLIAAVILLLCSVTVQAQKWTFGVESSGKELREGLASFAEGKYSAALKKLEKIHKNDTNYAQALYERVITHTALKEFDKGITVAEEALDLDNDFKNRYYRALGALYTKKEDGVKAIEVLDEAIAKYPLDYTLVFEKIKALNSMEKYEEGFKLTKELIKANPEYPDPHYLLGRMCAEEGYYTQSIMSLTNYMILNPLSIYNAPLKGPSTLETLRALNNLSSNSIDFGDTEEEVEEKKEKLERRDLSFMNEGYEDMDNIIENQVNVTKKYKTKSKITLTLVKQVHYVINNRKGAQTEGFWADFYGPYFDKIIEEKSFPDLMMLICARGYSREFVDKNLKAIIAFNKKNTKDWRDMHCKMDITLDGKTEKRVHHFSGGILEGLGVLEDEKPTGNWTYFHENGVVSATGSWDSKGERNGKWVWHHSNGELQEENTFVNGELNGLVTMFRKEGTKSYHTIFKDDKVDGDKEYFEIPGYRYALDETNENTKEGWMIYYYPNGQKSYEVKYKNGEKEGVLKRYFENGVLKLEENYKADELQGESKSYNLFSILINKTNYSDGKKDGNTVVYNNNGSLKEEKVYKDGKIVSRKQYFRNGTLKKDLKFEGGKISGLMEVYDEDGKPYYNIKYKEGDPQLYKYFDKNGGIVKSGKLKKRTLEYNGVYPTGERKVSGKFEEGSKEGTWKFYARGGWIESEEKFKNGLLSGLLKSYFPNGEINTTTNYSYGRKDGKFESYYSNGKMYAEGYYRYGKKIGEWRYYELNGELTSLKFYNNGEQDGMQHYYTYDGKEYKENTRKEDFLMSVQLLDSTETKTSFFDILNEGKEVHTYSNGKSSMESNYVNCFKSGVFKWIYPDGSIEVNGNFNNDNRIGEWLSYYPDGTLSRKRYYVQGDKDSLWEYFHSNGNLQRKEQYKFGEQTGNSEYYYSDGKLKSTEPYVGSRRHGKSNHYNREGILVYSKLFVDGKFIAFIHPNGDTAKIVSGEKEYIFLSKENKKLAVINTKNGMYHGSLKIYFSNGKVQKDYNYYEGNLNMKASDYYANGNLEKEANYTYGDLHGEYKKYYTNGKISEKSHFIYDDYYGKREMFNASGTKIKTLVYYNNLVIGEK